MANKTLLKDNKLLSYTIKQSGKINKVKPPKVM